MAAATQRPPLALRLQRAQATSAGVEALAFVADADLLSAEAFLEAAGAQPDGTRRARAARLWVRALEGHVASVSEWESTLAPGVPLLRKYREHHDGPEGSSSLPPRAADAESLPRQAESRQVAVRTLRALDVPAFRHVLLLSAAVEGAARAHVAAILQDARAGGAVDAPPREQEERDALEALLSVTLVSKAGAGGADSHVRLLDAMEALGRLGDSADGSNAAKAELDRITLGRVRTDANASKGMNALALVHDCVRGLKHSTRADSLARAARGVRGMMLQAQAERADETQAPSTGTGGVHAHELLQMCESVRHAHEERMHIFDGAAESAQHSLGAWDDAVSGLRTMLADQRAALWPEIDSLDAQSAAARAALAASLSEHDGAQHALDARATALAERRRALEAEEAALVRDQATIDGIRAAMRARAADAEARREAQRERLRAKLGAKSDDDVLCAWERLTKCARSTSELAVGEYRESAKADLRATNTEFLELTRNLIRVVVVAVKEGNTSVGTEVADAAVRAAEACEAIVRSDKLLTSWACAEGGEVDEDLGNVMDSLSLAGDVSFGGALDDIRALLQELEGSFVEGLRACV